MINISTSMASVSLSNIANPQSALFVASVDELQANKSNVSPLRERYIYMIEKFGYTENDAKQLLSTFSQPSTGGFLTAGLPDISSPDIMARHDRISEKFSIEQRDFEQNKNNLINDGLAIGKSSRVILKEIVDLYDAQPELFKLGVGWNGQVFNFNQSSTKGYQNVLEYSRDAVDIRV